MAKKTIVLMLAVVLFGAAATVNTADARERSRGGSDTEATSVVMQGAYANTGGNAVLGEADSDADADGRNATARATTNQMQTLFTGDAMAMNAADVRTVSDRDCGCVRRGRTSGDTEADSLVLQGAMADSGHNIVAGEADSDADADADDHNRRSRRSRRSGGGDATATASTTQDQFEQTGNAAAINWASVVTRSR